MKMINACSGLVYWWTHTPSVCVSRNTVKVFTQPSWITTANLLQDGRLNDESHKETSTSYFNTNLKEKSIILRTENDLFLRFSLHIWSWNPHYCNTKLCWLLVQQIIPLQTLFLCISVMTIFFIIKIFEGKYFELNYDLCVSLQFSWDSSVLEY